MINLNSRTGTKSSLNESWFCHPCGEIVPMHPKRPGRCKKCLQGYIEKVDKDQLMAAVAVDQQPEQIFQPAFDRTEQPVPSLLVNHNGVIVNPNEIKNKEKLAESNIKTKFPAREATSDITNPQCSICLENYVMKQHISMFSKEKPSQVVTLSCSHTYHADCVYQWLVKEPSCPTCRQPI